MRFFVLLLVGLSIASCSRTSKFVVEHDTIPVDNSYSSSAIIDSIVEPYKEDLKEEMNQVIAKATKDFNKGRPNSALNNWACDAVLSNQEEFAKNHNVMCLLNVGGLRNSINKGEVTIGDMYKLMPFDNEVVIVEMPMSVLPEIESYLLSRNGEPIGGATFENGKLTFTQDGYHNSTFWIITSDYLMGGGDDMKFFEKRLKTVYANILLRDLFIEEAKKQVVLVYNDEVRIQL